MIVMRSTVAALRRLYDAPDQTGQVDGDLDRSFLLGRRWAEELDDGQLRLTDRGRRVVEWDRGQRDEPWPC